MIAEDSIHKIRDVGESTFQRQNNVMQSVLNILSKIVLLVAVGTSLFALIYSVSKNPQSFLNVANFVKKSDSDTSSKPNFVFMLADDLGWNSIGYENYDLGFATPFLSNLASRGIKLDNYYAQEVCTPSRASLLTGRYPLSIGMQLDEVGPEDGWGLNLTETTLPEVLQSQGYATYMVGKWNLGHFSPRYLPTARGFDYFIGFLTGEAYHWSKRQASDSGFHDLIYSNADCYYPYNGTDLHKYSTFFYRDKAIDIINYHDFSTPLFLYVSFQAVHDPFNDIEYFQTGIPTKYLSSEIYDQIMKYVTGSKRVQYAMSLVLLDEAASNIYSALRDVGQLENTYIIFASDNGGCYAGGGKNGPLRGSKGSLWEGGTKVDAFIYSPLFEGWQQGKNFTGMMHVSDWFPTILELAGVEYTPEPGYDLDGVSQVEGFYGNGGQRDFMLYNAYIHINSKDFSVYNGGALAVRNNKYKLVHAYVDNAYSDWYQFYDENEDDDSFALGECDQFGAIDSGTYSYFLFDLFADPYETTNLYYDEKYNGIKDELYNYINELNWKKDYGLKSENDEAKNVWKENHNYITPWIKEDNLGDDGSYPDMCPFQNTVVSPIQYEYNDDRAYDDAIFTDDVTW